MLDEAGIREALLTRVRDRWTTATEATTIVEEFGTHFGASRIDVAIVNGHLRGYEIKSASDRLSRLPAQVNAYTDVFDYVTLVAVERHLDRAREIVPHWWEVIRATTCRDAVQLHQVVRGRRNPYVDPVAVARLLWRDELLRALEVHAADAGVRSATRERLAQRLAEALSPDVVGRIVRDQIRARPMWRGDPARMPGGERYRPGRTSSDFLARRLRTQHR